MFFILSKVLLILIQPIFWIFFLLIYSLIAKKARLKKRLLYTGIALLYIFSNNFLIDRFANLWNVDTVPPPTANYSCAIVLGGFTSVDKNGQGYFNAASDRFIQAVKLQKAGRISKILISGGSGLLFKGNDFKEADYVLGQLKQFGVPDSAILIENQSRSTFENALFSQRILQNKKIAGPYLLITSSFHMRRSLYTFKKAGVSVVPYACASIAGKGVGSFSDMIIPDAVALATWGAYTKEVVGMIAYYFRPMH